MLRKPWILTLLAAAAVAPLLAADTYTLDKNHCDVSFQVRHFVSKVRGRFTDFDGMIQADPSKPQASSVAFTIKATSIDTNQADRDKDLRSENFFDVAKFPDIAFKSSRITPVGRDRYAVQGTLTIHGVTKEVQLPVAFLGFFKDPRGNEHAGFELSTTLNRKDYGVKGGGPVVGDDVEISINLDTVKKKPEAAAAN
ncbi:MAG TPA: YceI family protein [Thermoanaerobaculia bacterium]|jgi:polyisoprenoid-binding protein YceI